MLNVKEITGAQLKKVLGLKRAVKQYHNKNSMGGNFGFTLLNAQGKFELTGVHDNIGTVHRLSFGELYQPDRALCDENNYYMYSFTEAVSDIEVMLIESEAMNN